MYLGITLIASNIVYSLIILIIFYIKDRVSTRETKLYGYLVIVNLINLVMELLCCYTVINYSSLGIITDVVNRVFLLSIFTWETIFTMYIYDISKPDDKKKIFDIKSIRSKIFIVFCIISSILMIILPIEYYNQNGVVYSFGISTDILYGIVFLYLIWWVLLYARNSNKTDKKKYIPILALIFIMAVAMLIRMVDPGFLIISSSFSIITNLMYFTIENPDVKMLQQTELAKEQAEKANRAKTDFLSSMSHEIRTPLNAIVGFSDCIMEAKDLREAQENAKDIVNASQTLLEIVNGILDISKIEAGKLEIVNSRYNAPETFLELAKLITPKMHEKGLDFTYKIASDLPTTLFGDHANLKKIVTNLLSNACKYTDCGYVHYEVNCVNSKDVSKLIITVEDSGRGIKKESIDKLFTKFQRLEEDRNTTIEGTGLGLAITKQLIELMGGKIIVHTVYGEGSKFTVVLNQKIETGELVEAKRIKTTLDLHNVRILMVDDTPLNLKVGCKLLEKYGADQIVCCDSGFECLEKIQRGEVYDVILLDDMMPKMSGVETLKKLKEISGFKTPTIALTANAITGMREKYLADGFNDYLAKPIEKEQLILVMNQILGRSMTEEIPRVVDSSDSPNVREEEIQNVASYDKNIIPVEENIEEKLGNQVERNYEETDVTLEDEKFKIDHIDNSYEEVAPVDLVPVVDLELSKEETENSESEEVYDEHYLEENGVDMNHALELLGDMEMYNMTISDFYKEIEEKWNKIVEYKEQDNMSEYAILVHSLKSDCKYLGFMTLADISYQHELKSKENDSTFVKEHFHELEKEYHKTLDVVQNYVKDMM